MFFYIEYINNNQEQIPPEEWWKNEDIPDIKNQTPGNYKKPPQRMTKQYTIYTDGSSYNKQKRKDKGKDRLRLNT